MKELLRNSLLRALLLWLCCLVDCWVLESRGTREASLTLSNAGTQEWERGPIPNWDWKPRLPTPGVVGGTQKKADLDGIAMQWHTNLKE